MSDPYRKERKGSKQSGAAMAEAKNGAQDTPAMEKQLQYLRTLEERNRIKKKLEEQSKNDKVVQEKEKEMGFTTNFNGENAHRKHKSQPRPMEKARAKSAGATKLGHQPRPQPDTKPEPKRETQSSGSLPLHVNDPNQQPRPKQKWSKPVGVAEQRDGRIVFREVPDTASDAKNEEDAEDSEDYLNESFEEFEEMEAMSQQEQPPVEVEAVPAPKADYVARNLPEEPINPLTQTTAELNALIQSLSRDKQKELVGLLQAFTSSKKDASDVNTLRQSIGDPALWNQLTAPLAQLTNNQREWEADVERKLKEEREASQRLVAEAEARRAEMLKKFEAEERELQALIAQRRQETLKALHDLTPNPNLLPNQPPVTVQDPLPAPPIANAALNSTPQDIPLPPQLDKVALSPVMSIETSESKPLPSQTSSPPKRAAVPNIVTQPVQMSLELPPAAPTLASTTGSLARSIVDSAVDSQGPRHEVRLKLLSSWGQTRVVGLTQVCVYDMEGNELEVLSDTLKLFSGQVDAKPIPKSNSMVRDLSRLFNGLAHTTNDTDMWLGRQIDSNPLQIAFQVSAVPSKVCIWNYNGKLHAAACVRDLEVFVDNQCKWTGSLPESFGSNEEIGCTWINVASSMRKKPQVQAAKESSSPPIAATQQPNEPSSTASSGPIWLTSTSRSESTSNLSLNSAKSNDQDVKIKPLDLSSRVSVSFDADVQTSSKPLTSRRRAQVETSTSVPVEQNISSAPPIVPPQMSSLQSSWDTLEHFKRTNRSRLEPQSETKPSESSRSLLPSGASVPSLSEVRHGSMSNLDKYQTQQQPARLAQLTSTSSKSVLELPRAASIVQNDIAIPILPRGRKLVVECLSTWGDPYYIGLNGIDIFDDHGHSVFMSSPETQVTAIPESINVLPEYSTEKDPRVAKNLVDGVNYTCDDLHMWLAPFTPNQNHSVTIQFDTVVAISMVRIWNYNKSRAHSFRGVKMVRLVLDNQVIFYGEIRQAPGILASVEQCCEVILFTTDEAILSSIEQVDTDPTVDATLEVVHDILLIPRPTTAEKEDDRRPKTAASNNATLTRRIIQEVVPSTSVQAAPATNSYNGYRGRTIKLVFHSTWGDKHYVGLTGIALWVVRQNQIVSLPLTLQNLHANPRDLHTLGYTGDPRTLDKLVNSVNVTCDDTNMWLVPFEGGKKPELIIQLPSTEDVLFGLDVWNYNKSPEDTFRGAKLVQIFLDNAPFATWAFRKAPGHSLFDFKQTIIFEELSHYRLPPIAIPTNLTGAYKTHLIKQDYEPPLFPMGFIVKIVLWSTWGDPYYIGLNGLEFYDAQGQQLPPPTLMAATPSSLADIEVKHDVRVVQNLFNGQNNTWDASDAWLSPLASSLGRSEGNLIYAVYDSPVALAMIKVYNYSKTPDRGAREIEIYVDDLKVYMGSLRQAPPAPGLARTGKIQQGVEFGQPILFTLSPSIVEPEKRKILYCGSEDQDVLCINEGQVVIESKAMYRAPDPGAEGVQVDLDKRPTTAVCRK